MLEADGEILVLTTVANSDQAVQLARGIVEKRLAACVTCLPAATSFFRWQSEAVSEESEVVLLIKTHRSKLPDLERHFETGHPYSVPELVALDITALSAAYGGWMREELKLKSKGDA